MVNSRLVLLFGMPRSGTTWLGKIFDSHPETLYRHEPDAWGRLNAIPLLADPAQGERYARIASEFIASLSGMRDVKVSATLPVFKKRYYSAFDHYLQVGSVKVSKAASKLVGEFPVPLPRPKGVAPVMTWKSIESIGRLGLLARLFPGARCVHILRHPCGYVASVKRGEAKGKFSERLQSSEDYGVYERLLETPQAKRRSLNMDSIQRMQPIERLALRWLLFNEKAMEDCENLGNCMSICYEDVCRDPEAGTRTMFEFAGLDWAEQTAQFVGASTASERDSYYSVYKDPLRAANKWRLELNDEEVARIRAVVEGSRPARRYQLDDDASAA